MPAHKGSRNNFWKGGVSQTSKGYRRIWSGPGRKQYEHRWKIKLLLQNPIGLIFSPGQDIPDGFHIHHQDHNRTHNCPSNLMLLQECIHNALSRSHRIYLLNHQEEYWEWLDRKRQEEQDRDLPEWVKEVTVNG